MPTLAIAFFVSVQEKVQETRKHCGDYVAKLFLAIDHGLNHVIDSTIAQNIEAFRSIKTIFHQSHINELQIEIGC